MAFTLASFTQINGGWNNVNRSFQYTTTDALATVIAVGYFNEVQSRLKVNDTITVASDTGGTPIVTFTYVNANALGVVDVVNGLTIPNTDTT